MKRAQTLMWPLLAALLLGGCAVPPTYTSTQPPPSVAEVSDAQQRLRGMGFYNGSVDGIWGPETQFAIERYQRSRGIAATARLDQPTAAALRNEAPDVAALRAADEQRRAEEARRRAELAKPISVTDATDVRTIQNRMRQLNLYDGPADGVWNQRTQASMEGFQRAKGLPVGQLNRQTLAAMDLDPNTFGTSRTASAALMARPLDPAVIRRVQVRLRSDGFYAGAPDGVWGPRTQMGLERFQRSRGIEPTGQLDPTTAAALGMDPNNLAGSVR